MPREPRVPQLTPLLHPGHFQFEDHQRFDELVIIVCSICRYIGPGRFCLLVFATQKWKQWWRLLGAECGSSLASSLCWRFELVAENFSEKVLPIVGRVSDTFWNTERTTQLCNSCISVTWHDLAHVRGQSMIAFARGTRFVGFPWIIQTATMRTHSGFAFSRLRLEFVFLRVLPLSFHAAKLFYWVWNRPPQKH